MAEDKLMGHIQQLECGLCQTRYRPDLLQNLCSCGGSLFAVYDLAAVRESWSKEQVARKGGTMWRYDALLPADSGAAVTLREGWTPHYQATTLGAELNLKGLWIKDDGRNPTDSFKARGMSVAVTMAKQLGARKLAVASAGNAAGALAAYCAAAGIEAHIFMPCDVPHGNFLECEALGAHVTLVDGLINDCARIVAERKEREGWFDVSTLKEPYRVEGKKTMGLEIAEQLGWTLPDAILYPCGGGVGLIGMWKAFDELQAIGWIDSRRPKMIAVQAQGCQPIAAAFEEGDKTSRLWPDAYTVASGLRVPKPLGDVHILRILRESGGTAVAVSDAEMMDGAELIGRTQGLFVAPEGGATVAALKLLLQRNFLHPDQHILLYNTGSGLKYLEAFSTRFSRRRAGEQDKLGGLITPR